MNEYDVVVIGGGAAGLSGALALARSRRSVLVIDEGTPRNAPAEHVHNFLTRDGVPPAELYALGRAEVAGYGAEVRTGTVTAVSPRDDGFEVESADGTVVRARRLLVTTGLADELPDVQGLAERFGRDVLHCPYCHGWEVRDQAIGVLATGGMAIHQTMMFRQLSDNVTLFLNDGQEPTEQEWEELAARGISVVQGKVVEVEVTDDKLSGVRLESGKVIPCQALVVQPHAIARAAFLEELGLVPAEVGAEGVSMGTVIPSEPGGKTTVPGVWVAGNVADPRAQVITSAAAGLAAGAVINFDLIEEEIRLAVAARSS
ncbi:NAD(P)/FAD-dependent oxidoreductase [Kribbella qitaiheensis]|uniref:NAD(P)/FAD-dependent oxidoreductase n=1 Tax=Kribbella qitaiheensis TaxID=1544730 RepID=A0A7G6WUC2_9ACTN|nr:NAD(P)/FAD-dependent oxidoreductase [Kribbella qitaiheensis]QNE17587.1 NAD(P)/FAD-dependent oxidoreductase [Kribbella qitaiheensis]